MDQNIIYIKSSFTGWNNCIDIQKWSRGRASPNKKYEYKYT